MAQNFDFQKIIDFDKKVLTTQFFCFDGRMSKKDFWTFIISTWIVALIPFIGWIAQLVFLLPVLGATARRLHDLGKTGWLQLIGLVCPPIGSIVVLIMCIPDGQKEANKFGEPVGDYDAASGAAE